MRWLTHDWDSRDPVDDLHDIDTGKYLQAIAQLPQNIRSLLQDTEVRIEVAEVGDHYRITKIVKKREPEFLQGSDSHFYFDNEGMRVPVSEQEMDELIGISHNPDDVYNTTEVERESIHTEHSCPRDVWDVIFDATEFVREAQRAIRLHEEEVYKLEPGVLEQLAEETIYSADWFPYSVDKRLHSDKARAIAARIEEGIERSELSRILRRPSVDQRPELIKKLRAEASKLEYGAQRGQLMVRAHVMNQQVVRFNLAGGDRDTIGNADRRKLWDLWRARELGVHGKVELMSWQFKKAYQAKLNRQVRDGEISDDEASQRLSQRMEQHYGAEAQQAKKASSTVPQWLQDAGTASVDEVDDFEFESQDWLPDELFVTQEIKEDSV